MLTLLVITYLDQHPVSNFQHPEITDFELKAGSQKIILSDKLF